MTSLDTEIPTLTESDQFKTEFQKILQKPQSQIDKFRETARALESDESEEKFAVNLKKVATKNPKKNND